MSEAADFRGLHVVAFESRMAAETRRLIERHGGRPTVVPALREVPLEENPQALAFGDQLVAGRIDMVLFLTGAGTEYLFNVLKTRHALDDLIRALSTCTLVARGPKPAMALKRLGLAPQITAPEPNTSDDLLRILDERQAVRGQRVAVQEYGAPNEALVDELNRRGADVLRVPVYRWALPEDTTELTQTIDAIIAGTMDVMVVTNAVQVDHLMQVAGPGKAASLRGAVRRMVLASIGPTATARLRHHGFSPTLEPSHPKLGILIKETAEYSQAHAVRSTGHTAPRRQTPTSE